LIAAVARERRDRLGERVREGRRGILPVAMAATLGAALFAPWFFWRFYDKRYADACWIAPLASITVWIALLEESASRALLAVGATRALAVSGAVNVAVMAVAWRDGTAID